MLYKKVTVTNRVTGKVFSDVQPPEDAAKWVETCERKGLFGKKEDYDIAVDDVDVNPPSIEVALENKLTALARIAAFDVEKINDKDTKEIVGLIKTALIGAQH